MDALDLLTADHNRVRGLIAQFKAAHESDDTNGMTDSVTKIIEELEAHTTIEEEIFYPAVRAESDEINETVAEGLEEHHIVKILIKEIEALEPGAEQWVAKVQVMIENVDHHAEEEENELFPSVRSETAADHREALGLRLESRKAELGAPTPADAENLSKDELAALASAQHIPGRSSMDVHELKATVDARAS